MSERHVIAGFEGEYATLKRNADKAIAQLDAAAIRASRVGVGEGAALEGNSIAEIMKDVVDEASQESFPASDPPGYTSASASPEREGPAAGA